MIALSNSDLVAIFKLVNEAFAHKRRSISLRENRGPHSGFPVRADHVHIAIPPMIPRNSSIYVKNIELDATQAANLISGSLNMIKEFQLASQRMKWTESRVIDGELEIVRTLDRLAVDVQSFDKQVAMELHWLFRQITRQNPTMGGYKKTKAKSVYLAHRMMLEAARPIESPFAVFAMALLAFANIKRGNGRPFSTTDIRNALEGEWTGASDLGDEDWTIQAYIEAEAEDTERLGRPPKGLEREQFTKTDEPDNAEYLNRDELNALFRQLAREKWQQRRSNRG